MFTPSFLFFPNLSDSHMFLSSSSLPSAHPFLKVSIDPFPSEVWCPSFISRFLGSLQYLLHMQTGSWWWNVLLLKATYSCSERSAVLATNRFVQDLMEKSFPCCFQWGWWLMFALAWMKVVARTRIILTAHIGPVSKYVLEFVLGLNWTNWLWYFVPWNSGCICGRRFS